MDRGYPPLQNIINIHPHKRDPSLFSPQKNTHLTPHNSGQLHKVVNMAAVVTQQTIEIPEKYKAAVYDKPGTISTKVEE